MKGQILDYSVQTNTGTITGSDGGRYTFTGSEWKGNVTPARGMAVDFESDGTQAKGVFIALGSAAPGEKNKVVAGVLAILLGGLGIHKFYLGFTVPGLIYLLVNTVGFFITWLFLFIPNIVLGVMALVEGIIYLTKSDEEFDQLYVQQKKQWF